MKRSLSIVTHSALLLAGTALGAAMPPRHPQVLFQTSTDGGGSSDKAFSEGGLQGENSPSGGASTRGFPLPSQSLGEAGTAEGRRGIDLAIPNYAQRLQELEAEKQQTQQDLHRAQDLLAKAQDKDVASARRSKFDLRQEDWTALAKTGTIRYYIPCASFRPPPALTQSLGLDPRESQAAREAFTRIHDDTWATVRKACGEALGSEIAADRLGLDLCTQVVLQLAQEDDQNEAMRRVAEYRAGRREPPTETPAVRVLLAMTNAGPDLVDALGRDFDPETARAIAFGDHHCASSGEIAGPGPRDAN